MNLSLLPRGTLLFSTVCVASLIAGCAAPPKPVPVVIHEATPGTAVMYFFRPENDHVDEGALPTIAVDHRTIGTFAHSTYTMISLTPGKHQVAMTAGASDSTRWNQSADFTLADGVTYYVAIWQPNQPTPVPSYVSAMYGALGTLIFESLNRSASPGSVQLEPVARDIAEISLPGLQFVPPENDALLAR
jgi:hypothetical protein